ncbi:hypothetical protein SFRURICE_021472 [Spodoptera frugiperda]|nr:hypothetical protein SFRURICE_021472 [Spodoptera frugiperda]
MMDCIKVRVYKPTSYATDFSLSCIETHRTASSNPRRMDRIISNAMRTNDVIRSTYDAWDVWPLDAYLKADLHIDV